MRNVGAGGDKVSVAKEISVAVAMRGGRGDDVLTGGGGRGNDVCGNGAGSRLRCPCEVRKEIP